MRYTSTPPPAPNLTPGPAANKIQACWLSIRERKYSGGLPLEYISTWNPGMTEIECGCKSRMTCGTRGSFTGISSISFVKEECSMARQASAMTRRCAGVCPSFTGQRTKTSQAAMSATTIPQTILRVRHMRLSSDGLPKGQFASHRSQLWTFWKEPVDSKAAQECRTPKPSVLLPDGLKFPCKISHYQPYRPGKGMKPSHNINEIAMHGRVGLRVRPGGILDTCPYCDEIHDS
jgi:hypothetical protein